MLNQIEAGVRPKKCRIFNRMKNSILIFSAIIGICVAFDCDDLGLMKVGCRKRNKAVFSDILANNRDVKSKAYIGESINWSNFEQSLKNLACACAKKAAGKYAAVALGYYGECFGAKDEKAYTDTLEDPSQESNDCINHKYKDCNDKDEMHCVGRDNAEYVYTFPKAAPEKINGGYTEWSKFTECSASCGEGIQARERSCTNPVPNNGGSDCEALGPSTETKSCKIKECPVNGGYGDWTAYESCSKSCGGGTKTRTRECDSPAPAHGGLPCDGPSSEEVPCNTQGCPVNGGWSGYGLYGSCSRTCGGGTKTRTRSCTNPAPKNGGSECSGSESQSISCNTQPCLRSNLCSTQYTSWDKENKGEAIYLDRHTLHCSAGYVMKSMQLERNPEGTQIRYRYICCRSQLSCSDSLTIHGETFHGGANGNTVYLDRQDINCNKKGISYLKLDRSGDKWNYKFDCCKVGYSSASVSCYDTNSGFSDDGKGEVIYLDRHHVNCNDNYFITKMKLVRNSDLNKYRYDYKCCKINTPSATN